MMKYFGSIAKLFLGILIVIPIVSKYLLQTKCSKFQIKPVPRRVLC